VISFWHLHVSEDMGIGFFLSVSMTVHCFNDDDAEFNIRTNGPT
jgi:hypothetical protein